LLIKKGNEQDARDGKKTLSNHFMLFFQFLWLVNWMFSLFWLVNGMFSLNDWLIG
jgi:hypothetical protein